MTAHPPSSPCFHPLLQPCHPRRNCGPVPPGVRAGRGAGRRHRLSSQLRHPMWRRAAEASAPQRPCAAAADAASASDGQLPPPPERWLPEHPRPKNRSDVITIRQPSAAQHTSCNAHAHSHIPFPTFPFTFMHTLLLQVKCSARVEPWLPRLLCLILSTTPANACNFDASAPAAPPVHVLTHMPARCIFYVASTTVTRRYYYLPILHVKNVRNRLA